MPQASLTFDDLGMVRLLFGPQDRFLRLIRDGLSVNALLRADVVTITGDSELRVEHAKQAFQELQAIIERQGHASEDDVLTVLARHEQGTFRPEEHGLDMFEKSRRVLPKTIGQAHYIRCMKDNDLVFCMGPAGCGKSYLAVAMAIHQLRMETVKKIVLVRPAVEAGEKLGFLPGDILAKVNPFLRPLLDALNDLLDHEQVQRYMEKDVIEIVPLAFMRGRTLSQTFIILDEAQNTTITQMKMFLTRMGMGSKIIVTGDVTQIDLPPHITSGLPDAVRRLSNVDGIASVKLTGRDISRHPLVKRVVEAYGDVDSGHY